MAKGQQDCKEQRPVTFKTRRPSQNGVHLLPHRIDLSPHRIEKERDLFLAGRPNLPTRPVRYVKILRLLSSAPAPVAAASYNY